MDPTIYTLTMYRFTKSGNDEEILGFTYSKDLIERVKDDYEQRYAGSFIDIGYEFVINEVREFSLP